MTTIDTDSNLVRHAVRELTILGTSEESINEMVSIIQAFANIGPSGGQASWMIPILNELLQFHNLTPLTDERSEWNNVGDGMWQSNRRSEAFSHDGGRTYYLLSEGASSQNPKPIHVSVMTKH